MPRQTEWKDNMISQVVAAGATALESLVANFTDPDKRGMTLVRTLIRLEAMSTTVAGAWGVQIASMGIGVASQEAFNLGVTAVSDPQTEANKPTRGWVWRTQMLVSQNGVSTPITSLYTADIRAARKLENGELFLIINNSDAVGTSASIQVLGVIRTLFKLP